VPLLGVHTLHSFRDPAPWQAGTGITHGPNAGLLTTAQGWRLDCRTRLSTAAWVGPEDSLLAFAQPATYLYTPAPPATNIVWLGPFGRANQQTVDWLDDRDAWPDVVVVIASVSASWDRHTADDPLLRRLAEDYGTPVDAGPFGVLRRDGATSPPGGPADLSACDLP
jgi:hypothetical protein